MNSKKKKILIFVLWIFSIFVAYLFGHFSAIIFNIGPEYKTADVIKQTTFYVKRNSDWPRSWEDLKIYDNKAKSMVIMNFQIDIDSCNCFDIAKSILPRSKYYRMYPWAGKQMEDLYKLILTIRNKNNQAAQEDRQGTRGLGHSGKAEH